MSSTSARDAEAALQTSTDHGRLRTVLDAAVSRDPVRGTLLGTIRLGLTPSAWAAWGDDRGCVAARSEAIWPVAVVGDWTRPLLDSLLDVLAELDELRGVAGAEEVVEYLLAGLGRSVATREGQGLFRLDTLVPPQALGAPLLAGEVHRHLVREWFMAFAAEVDDIGPDIRPLADGALDARLCWLWVDADGTPVSVAARRPVVAGSARIGPVYTPPTLRGHGYASAVTAAASRTILDERAVAVLFTDLANPTSNRIYQAIGFRPVEQRLIVTFA